LADLDGHVPREIAEIEALLAWEMAEYRPDEYLELLDENADELRELLGDDSAERVGLSVDELDLVTARAAIQRGNFAAAEERLLPVLVRVLSSVDDRMTNFCREILATLVSSTAVDKPGFERIAEFRDLLARAAGPTDSPAT
jgi:hypothetical protein